MIDKEVSVSTQKVLKTVYLRGADLTAETWTEVPHTTLCKYKEYLENKDVDPGFQLFTDKQICEFVECPAR